MKDSTIKTLKDSTIKDLWGLDNGEEHAPCFIITDDNNPNIIKVRWNEHSISRHQAPRGDNYYEWNSSTDNQLKMYKKLLFLYKIPTVDGEIDNKRLDGKVNACEGYGGGIYRIKRKYRRKSRRRKTKKRKRRRKTRRRKSKKKR